MTEQGVWPQASEGSTWKVQLITGQIVEGVIESRDVAWLTLRTESGLLALARHHIVMIALEGGMPQPVTKSRKRHGAATAVSPSATRSEAEIPDGETLRRVASAILDGIEGPELRAISGLSASHLARLRQAFECARGNLQREDLPPAARAWVDPIRKALGG